VDEKWLMAPVSRRIGLFSLAAATTVTATILRCKPCEDRLKRRISHRRGSGNYAIHVLRKVGLVPRWLLLLLLLLIAAVLGIVRRQHLAAIPSYLAWVHLWVRVGCERNVELGGDGQVAGGEEVDE